MAEWRAMSKTAISEDSMPTARTNPLTWQKAEPEGMPPPTKLTMANMTKTKAFAKSLWIKSKINSCRKLRLIFTNQYRADSVDKTLTEAKVTDRINKIRIMWSSLSMAEGCRAAMGDISEVAAPSRRWLRGVPRNIHLGTVMTAYFCFFSGNGETTSLAYRSRGCPQDARA
jgi:hypothetical protein